jgi:hypothetical protein
MSKPKSLIVFALGTVLTLSAALPAAARDREDKAPREREARRISAPARGTQAGFSTFGESRSRIAIRRQSGPQTSARPDFMQKAECSGVCYDGKTGFYCWGETASCVDGVGCRVTGGGTTIELICTD